MTPARLTITIALSVWLCAAAQTPLTESVQSPDQPSDTNGSEDVLESYTKLAAQFALEEEEETDVFFYTCRNVRSSTLARVIGSFLTPAGTVDDSDEADMLVVSDVQSNLEMLKMIAEKLDQPVPQVLVQARIIEFTVDSQFEKQINAEFQRFRNIADIPNVPGGTMDFVKRLTEAFVSPGSNPGTTQGRLSWAEYDAGGQHLLSLFIRFLETRGKAKILSAPNLILRRGTAGSIITGEEVPIQTQTVTSGSVSTSTVFKSVGIKLRVTPIMIAGDKVRLEVSPEVSNVTRVDSSGAPIIAVRSASTELEVLDGQLVSIGGLLRSEERETHRRVPVLGSLPYLGHFFRGTETQSVQTQLVIFLTIEILDDSRPPKMIRPDELPEDVQREIERIENSLDAPKPSMDGDLKRWRQDSPAQIPEAM